MTSEPTSGRPKHANNLSSLRLLFAVLVILSHSSELVDGNRSRELLTRLFGTMSFGEVSVDGFFLISGYLITKSFLQSKSVISYLSKRVCRIVPGYVMSFALCFFLLAPLVGASDNVSLAGLRHFVSQTTRLLSPEALGAFSNLPQPSLNGAMWTISYEFRCYIAVALIGLIAARLRLRREWLIAAVAAGVAAMASKIVPDLPFSKYQLYCGNPVSDIRFGAIFGVGSLFYVFRDRISLNVYGSVAALALLLCGLLNPNTAEAAFTLFGGYLIFLVAFVVPRMKVSQMADSTDISYGIYLYGWPIQNSIIYLDRNINPWILTIMTLTLATFIALLSWRFIEKPFVDFGHRMSRSRSRLLPQFGPQVERGWRWR